MKTSIRIFQDHFFHVGFFLGTFAMGRRVVEGFEWIFQDRFLAIFEDRFRIYRRNFWQDSYGMLKGFFWAILWDFLSQISRIFLTDFIEGLFGNFLEGFPGIVSRIFQDFWGILWIDVGILFKDLKLKQWRSFLGLFRGIFSDPFVGFLWIFVAFLEYLLPLGLIMGNF